MYGIILWLLGSFWIWFCCCSLFFSDVRSGDVPNYPEMLANAGAIESLSAVVSKTQAEEVNV